MNEDPSNQAYLGVLRHLLTALGGILVSHGWLASSELSDFVGLLLIVAPVVWSIMQKCAAARQVGDLKQAVARVTDTLPLLASVNHPAVNMAVSTIKAAVAAPAAGIQPVITRQG